MLGMVEVSTGAAGDEVAGLRDEVHVADALLRLSTTLSDLRDPEETLAVAVRHTAQLLGAPRCFAVSWDPVLRQFFVLAQWGCDGPHLALIQELAEKPGGLPILHEALTQGVVQLVGDAAADPRLGAEAAMRRSLGSYIAIPLARGGEQLGALAVEFDEPRVFGTTEEALAEGIGRQVANALVASRRLDLMRELRSFGLNVGRVTRLAPVVQEVAVGAARLLRGDGAAVYLYDATQKLLTRTHTAGAVGDTAPAHLDLTQEPWSGLLDANVVVLARDENDDAEDVREEVPVAMIAAPILGSDAPLAGAVLVFFDRFVSLGKDEAEALSVLGAQSSMALENAQRFERQRRVARSLQEGLLATETPPLHGFRIDAVYEPASHDAEIGGDFFDVFDLGEGIVGIVVGDVSGKGAEAAAQTAQAKYMLRAFAIRNASPASVLYHLNNALVHGFAEDRFATCMFGVFDTNSSTGQIALAGHPPPLVFRRDGTVETFELPGTILGMFEDQQFEQTSFHLDQGDVFVAYTDGLTEARRDKELYGIERVSRQLARCAGDPSCDVARTLYEDAQSFGEVTDDTVVFALRASGDD